jgi:uroporphyrinogen decarboxylase
MPAEEGVAKRLDAHFGGPDWRTRLPPYILGVGAVSTDPKVRLDEAHERDAYGGVWRTDRRPQHLERPPLERPSFEGYQFPKPETFFRPEMKAASFRKCRETPDSFRLAGLGWGLFERSWLLRGFENALVDAMEEPEFYEEALDRLTNLYLAFIEYTCDLPVDGVLFGDDWGDQRGVILGAERWRKFLKPRWAKLYAAVHVHGMLALHHSCGSVAELMPDLIEIGLDVLESVQPEAAGMDPCGLKRRWGDHLCFWGCVGSQRLLPFASPGEIQREVRRLCREMGRGGGCILAPAKPLQPETPTENAAALLEAFTKQNG